MGYSPMFYPMFDRTWIFLIPGLLLGLYAQMRLKTAFGQYRQIRTRRGWTGEAVARDILNRHGLQEVRIEATSGMLSDHYDPRSKVLRLSSSVFGETSIAAVSVAAHEVGHALQDQEGYGLLRLRNALVPTAQVGSQLAFLFVFLGLVSGALDFLIPVGIALFSVAVVFQLVTLPVEYDASHRAEIALQQGGYVTDEELRGTHAVLSAAALTYVAALVSAIGSFLRLLAISRGGRRE